MNRLLFIQIMVLFLSNGKLFADQSVLYKIKDICPQKIVESNGGKTIYVQAQGDRQFFQRVDLQSGLKSSTLFQSHADNRNIWWSDDGNFVVDNSPGIFRLPEFSVYKADGDKPIWKDKRESTGSRSHFYPAYLFSVDNKTIIESMIAYGPSLSGAQVWLDRISLWDFANKKLIKEFKLGDISWQNPQGGRISPSGKNFYHFSFVRWRDKDGKFLPVRMLKIDIPNQRMEKVELPKEFENYFPIENFEMMSEEEVLFSTEDDRLFVFNISSKELRFLGQFKGMFGRKILKNDQIFFATLEKTGKPSENKAVIRVLDTQSKSISTKTSFLVSADRKAAFFNLSKNLIFIGDDMCEDLFIYSLPN